MKYLLIALTFIIFPLATFAAPIKVGVIFPLTGEASTYGDQFRHGMQLNSKTSNFELIFEDSKFQSQSALTAFHKLVDVDHVSFLISFGGATCEVLNAQARIRQIVHIAAGCNTAKFDSTDSVNFRLDVNEALAAQQTATYLKKSGFKKVALLYVNNSWGSTIINYTKEALHNVGLKIVTDIGFDAAEAGDLRSALARIPSSKADVIFMISLPNLTPLLLKQIHENRVGSIPIMSNISVENPEVVRLAGKNADGIFYLSVKPEPESRKAFPIFYAEFPQGNPFAAWGFDSISLLSMAAKGSSPSHVLQNLKGFVGAFNTYNFDSKGELYLDYEIREIKDGEYVWKSEL